jgi:hypothetical protein
MSALESELLKLNKQQIVDQICEIAKLPQSFPLSRGSSVPNQLFIALEEKFHVPSANGMHGKAAAFCDHFDVPWDSQCDSVESPSGGGGTVTKIGLVRIALAVSKASALS